MKTVKSTVLPVIALRDMVIVPNRTESFYMGREKSILAMKAVSKGNKLIILIPQKNPKIEDPDPADLHTFGTIAQIISIMPLEAKNVEEAYGVIVEGKKLVRVIKFLPHKKYLQCEFKQIKAKKIKIGYTLNIPNEGESLNRTIIEFTPSN